MSGAYVAPVGVNDNPEKEFFLILLFKLLFAASNEWVLYCFGVAVILAFDPVGSLIVIPIETMLL